MWGWVIIAAVFVVALSQAAAKERRKLPPLVLLIGDSLAQGLGPPLTRMLAARGVVLQSVAVQGSSARDWRREFLKKALDSSPASLVLISLGTNDAASRELAAEFTGNAGVLAERLDVAKRRAIWLMPPKLAPAVRFTLSQPQFDTLDPPAGLRLDATGHPLGDGYERWAFQILAAFEPTG